MSTTTMTAAVDAVLGEGAAVKMIGEIIAWEMHGAKSLAAVRAALSANGFDAKQYAPDFKHPNVFARVCERLGRDGRIIKRMRAGADVAFSHFQFNQSTTVKLDAPKGDAAEPVEGSAEAVDERVEYPFEDIVTLGKETGTITCKNDDFQAYLAGEMARVAQVRTANDVTNIVQRMFVVYGKTNKDADLFAIRSGGGSYFVLDKHREFIDRVHEFVKAVAGRFIRFPIPVGTETGNLSVADTVESGLRGLIHEFDRAVDSLNEASRKGTLDKAAERVEELREKIECYNVYLGSAREKLLSQVAESDKMLRAKLIEITAVGSVDAPAADAGEQADADEPAELLAAG